MEYFQIPPEIFFRPSFQLFSAVKAERVKISGLCSVDIFSWNVSDQDQQVNANCQEDTK